MTDTPDEAAAETVDGTKCYSEISSTTVDSMEESNTDVSNSDVNHSECDRESEIVYAAKSVRISCGGRLKQKRPKRVAGNEEIQMFALMAGASAIKLKAKGKQSGLVITSSGDPRKQCRNSYRLYFGLPTSMRKIVGEELSQASITAKVELHLFKFNMRQDGMYYCSPCNAKDGLLLYMRYREIYINWCQRRNSDSAILSLPGSCRRKHWSSEDAAQLVELRCETNPPTFRQIAAVLNMVNKRAGKMVDREYSTSDCLNKWARMFPSSMDANKAIEFLKVLKKKWPGLTYATQTEPGTKLGRPPALIGLHVVWPWARKIMDKLSPSIFCDGTHKVTLYNYKVVMITTVDGNKHHRPLMASFITRSTAEQWRKIFNIFARYTCARMNLRLVSGHSKFHHLCNAAQLGCK